MNMSVERSFIDGPAGKRPEMANLGTKPIVDSAIGDYWKAQT